MSTRVDYSIWTTRKMDTCNLLAVHSVFVLFLYNRVPEAGQCIKNRDVFPTVHG